MGYCAHIKRPIVIAETRLSTHYNKKVDLNTKSPIITLPLMT